MNRAKTVDEYIENSSHWKDALNSLREIMLSTPMRETVKWGAPCYTVNGKMVVGLGAFKSYVGLWFHQGALLADASNKLINAQEGITKALRQWRFHSADEIRSDASVIAAYVQEAILNQEQGNEIKPSRKNPLVVPPALKCALESDAALDAAFANFAPSKQREFAEYIAGARREETKTKRLEKIIPMIRDGVGLNDKYRK